MIKIAWQIRMSADLHSRLKRAAELSGRSLNSEMIATLERGLAGPVDADLSIALDKWKRGHDGESIQG
jgi:predicted DNA-binding protein